MLGEVIVRPQVQPLQALVEFRTRREEDDRQRDLSLPDVAEDAQPVATGQHDVQDQGIVGARRGEGITVVALQADIHDKPLCLQPFADERGDLLFVLDD